MQFKHFSMLFRREFSEFLCSYIILCINSNVTLKASKNATNIDPNATVPNLILYNNK